MEKWLLIKRKQFQQEKNTHIFTLINAQRPLKSKKNNNNKKPNKKTTAQKWNDENAKIIKNGVKHICKHVLTPISLLYATNEVLFVFYCCCVVVTLCICVFKCFSWFLRSRKKKTYSVDNISCVFLPFFRGTSLKYWIFSVSHHFFFEIWCSFSIVYV